MDYFTYLFQKFCRATVVTMVLIAVLWGTLYSLTDFGTVADYFWAGLVVCSFNTVLINLRQGRFEKIFHVSGNWVIMAGTVLVLYHAGFVGAAVFVAAAILASPFFGATFYESIVGFTLLIQLAKLV